MEEVTTLIRDLGFPISVCVYLIWNQVTTMNKWSEMMAEFKGTIETNTAAINSMNSVIDSLKALITSLHAKEE